MQSQDETTQPRGSKEIEPATPRPFVTIFPATPFACGVRGCRVSLLFLYLDAFMRGALCRLYDDRRHNAVLYLSPYGSGGGLNLIFAFSLHRLIRSCASFPKRLNCIASIPSSESPGKFPTTPTTGRVERILHCRSIIFFP